MTWSSVDLDSFCENEEVIGRREASDHISYRQWPMDRLSSLKWYYVKRSLRCVVHRLISPMHRTDVSIDASNFQPMNGIKQHLGESYHVRFVYVTRYRPICAIDRSRSAIYGSVVGASIDRSCSYRWMNSEHRPVLSGFRARWTVVLGSGHCQCRRILDIWSLSSYCGTPVVIYLAVSS